MKQLKQIIPGILLCLSIAAPAWFLGKAFPIIGGPVFGILAGMLVILLFPGLPARKWKSFKTPEVSYNLGDGIRYTSKKLLQASIILLGFEMDLFHVIQVGSRSLFVMLFTISASFFTAFWAGKALKLHGKMTTLIGVGTSICGGSAIAATAPVIEAEDEDVAHAISTIFLFNIIAVFLFPALGHLLRMSDTGFGMFAGTAVNDTSSVVAAATSWSIAAGNDAALTFATIVKLTRTLMIVPITLVLAIYTSRKNAKSRNGSSFKFARVFPWFVLGFVLAAVLNTFAGVPDSLSHFLFTVGKFVIVMAMTAIGLNTNLKKLVKSGGKPILLGLCCWFAVATVSLLVQKLMGTW